MEMVNFVYEVTRTFPREEIYGLTNQMRRAAVSVPSNIAEGQGRKSTKEFMHHLSIAYGSLMEVETQAIISEGQKFLTPSQAEQLLNKTAEVGRLVNGLSNSLINKQSASAEASDH